MGSSSGKVLVVEDEPDLRDLALELLSDYGYEPCGAGSGDEALVILREHWEEFCLVFTDVNTAGTIDGLALARVVSSSWPSIGILITSGRGAPPREKMPDRAQFMPKPWRQATLMDSVHEACVGASG